METIEFGFGDIVLNCIRSVKITVRIFFMIVMSDLDKLLEPFDLM